MQIFKSGLIFIFVIVLALACQQTGQGETSLPTIVATPRLIAAVISETATLPAPSMTPTMANSAVPTAVPSPTASPTITPTPTPTHPLMIEVMRRLAYPGSEITFVETLDPGANYDRYVISYESEGNTIFALFTVPWGEPPASGWPVILFNHGWIRPEEYRTTERYIDYVDAIARSGYIVLRSDYRGHGNSEGEAIISYRSPGYTADVLNALAAVKTYPAADPDRIGMWGHSMGGNITLRAMVVSDEIKAGVIWGGVVVSHPDMFQLWRRPPGDSPTPTPNPTRFRSRWRAEWYEIYGSPEENPAFWAAISPNSYLADLSGPIQLHHGTADTSVPNVFSEILYAEGQAIGQPIELYLYEGDNHNLVIHFGTAMQRSIAFFDAHVKGNP